MTGFYFIVTAVALALFIVGTLITGCGIVHVIDLKHDNYPFKYTVLAALTMLILVLTWFDYRLGYELALLLTH